MKIAEALQKDFFLRVSAGSRWLVGDSEGGWIVYERLAYQKKTRTIIETKNEEEAVSALTARISDE